MSNFNDLQKIDPDNEFIKYISKRLKRDDYRGIHISQHNRYDVNYVLKLIKCIFDNVGGKLFEIPSGDYSERTGTITFEPKCYPEYQEIVKCIHTATDKGTYNSVKKNFFVDLDRMGLLKRSKIKIPEGKFFWYACLTNNAIELLESKDDKRKLIKKFTDLIDENLFGDFISNLVEFMSSYGYYEVDIFEFTFILNDMSITSTYKDILIRDYRRLTENQKLEVIDRIKSFANPSNFIGNKTEKRDFHNWINESQQIFSLLKFTTYFQVIRKNNKLYLRLNTSNETGIFTVEILKRSNSIKNQYFKLHKIKPISNFELHHIVPIKVVQNSKDLSLVDDVYNLVYIREDKHKEIHKKKTFKISNLTEKILQLENIKNNSRSVNINNGKEALYSKEKKILKLIEGKNKALVGKLSKQLNWIS